MYILHDSIKIIFCFLFPISSMFFLDLLVISLWNDLSHSLQVWSCNPTLPWQHWVTRRQASCAANWTVALSSGRGVSCDAGLSVLRHVKSPLGPLKLPGLVNAMGFNDDLWCLRICHVDRYVSSAFHSYCQRGNGVDGGQVSGAD